MCVCAGAVVEGGEGSRYLVWAATTFKHVFDYREGDVYWCTADCGWITGHTYIAYGPTALAATQVLLVFDHWSFDHWSK